MEAVVLGFGLVTLMADGFFVLEAPALMMASFFLVDAFCLDAWLPFTVVAASTRRSGFPGNVLVFVRVLRVDPGEDLAGLVDFFLEIYLACEYDDCEEPREQAGKHTFVGDGRVPATFVASLTLGVAARDGGLSFEGETSLEGVLAMLRCDPIRTLL